MNIQDDCNVFDTRTYGGSHNAVQPRLFLPVHIQDNCNIRMNCTATRVNRRLSKMKLGILETIRSIDIFHRIWPYQRLGYKKRDLKDDAHADIQCPQQLVVYGQHRDGDDCDLCHYFCHE